MNTQLSNQFKQTPVQGQLDLRLNTQNLAVRLDPAYGGASLIPGQAVKLVAAQPKGGIPIVTACTADSDDVYGFVNYDPKLNIYPAGAYMTISFFRGNVMYMTASTAIDRNVQVSIVVAGQQILPAAAGKMIVGRTIDSATALGDLVRVIIDLPGVLHA